MNDVLDEVVEINVDGRGDADAEGDAKLAAAADRIQRFVDETAERYRSCRMRLRFRVEMETVGP